MCGHFATVRAQARSRVRLSPGIVLTQMSAFTLVSLGAWLLVIANAAVLRGRLFATFGAIIAGMYTLAATSLAPLVQPTPLWPIYVGLHAIVYAHLMFLARPRMRPLLYRALISIPASFFLAGTVLSLPWGIAVRLGLSPWVPWLPYALAVIGLWQSLTIKLEDVHIAIDDVAVAGLLRHRPLATKDRGERPLRIVQISDPHLGPFMSVERLRKLCERAVQLNPDLVLLTGDFLTMESQEHEGHLTEALRPLAALAGRTFACRGNHDLEVPSLVAAGLAANDIRLLIDEAVVAETPWGEVEVLGLDFVRRNRSEHIQRVMARYPRQPGYLRVAMLHDPGAFRHVPEGAADLVLSGHTHGGQLGFLSVGGTWTVPRIIDMPDHGLWARGKDRLYVHRGTGHYGFPLRLGVPAEESVIHVHWRGAARLSQPGQAGQES